MESEVRIVVFSLDGRRYALYLEAVEKVVRAAKVTPLPEAPHAVLGILNYQGQVVPVFNTRQRFGLPEREIEPSDQFIIARTSFRIVALVADATFGVEHIPERQVVDTDKVLPGIRYVDGVVKLKDGMVLIHDLESFLSRSEREALQDALPMPGDR